MAPRTYDVDVAMDRALDLFWERGYDAVSVEDLVRATGMNRFGLYHRWGDKRGLLFGCIGRYAARMFDGPLASLTHPGAGRAEIEALFALLVAFATDPNNGRACFVLDTAVSLGATDPDLFAALRGYLDRIQQAFAAALTSAWARGELPPDFDIDAHAAHLALSMQAVALQGRTRPPPEAVHHFVRLALSTLESR